MPKSTKPLVLSVITVAALMLSLCAASFAWRSDSARRDLSGAAVSFDIELHADDTLAFDLQDLQDAKPVQLYFSVSNRSPVSCGLLFFLEEPGAGGLESADLMRDLLLALDRRVPPDTPGVEENWVSVTRQTGGDVFSDFEGLDTGEAAEYRLTIAKKAEVSPVWSRPLDKDTSIPLYLTAETFVKGNEDS